MAIADIISLFAFVLIATISPGGATTLSTASGASFGYRRSLPLIAGIAFGLGTMAAFAALGMSKILVAFPQLEALMRIAGSAYLLWLALQLLTQAAPGAASRPAHPRGFAAGIWLVWHNPKGWAMTTSASATYIGLVTDPARLALLLGLSFSTMAIFSLSVWCHAGRAIGAILTTPRQWKALNAALATLLVLSIIPLWHE